MDSESPAGTDAAASSVEEAGSHCGISVWADRIAAPEKAIHVARETTLSRRFTPRFRLLHILSMVLRRLR